MRHPDGFFGWVDLMSRDVGRSGQFYEALFGWTHVDIQVAEGVTHTHFYKDDCLVAGMSHMMPGIPESMGSMWNSYVLVDDLDATCSRVEDEGGTVTHVPWHLLDRGRMAMIEDPTGAVLGLLEPSQMQGAELFNAPGSLTWNELQTRQPDAVKPFYEQVFGWQWVDGPGEDYWVANLPTKEGDDKSNAGLMLMPPAVPAGAPNSWAVYFAVEDCAKAIETAERLDGQVFLPTMNAGPGRFTGLTDPTGGMFFVMQFD